jgi:hypothetical protein
LKGDDRVRQLKPANKNAPTHTAALNRMMGSK